MSPLTQITHVKSSAAYVGNSSEMTSKLVTQAGKIDGLSKAYYGFETEDPTNVFWVSVWTSKSAEEAYHQSDDFKAIRGASQDALAGTPSKTLVHFSSTEEIFSAPITEFVTFTLKTGISMDKLEPLVTQLQNGLQGTPKFYGSSWAPVVGKPDVYHGVLGWESVQAHWDAVGSGPLKEIIDQVKEIADLWLVHASLTQSDM